MGMDKDEEGKCPECGSGLEYDVLEPSDSDLASYEVHCPNCKWGGKEWYKMVFDGHEG